MGCQFPCNRFHLAPVVAVLQLEQRFSRLGSAGIELGVAMCIVTQVGAGQSVLVQNVAEVPCTPNFLDRNLQSVCCLSF